MYTSKQQWYQALQDSLGLEASDLDDLAAIMMETLPEAIDALQKASVASQDLRRHAHSIKGSSGNLGLTELSSLADQLESMVLKGAVGSPEYQTKVTQVQAEYDAFVHLMQS
ncbi:MAG: Hpt domain [Verrucomicrobiota bacterium]|jgi:HPt (histidine-containing phosphotransfer) domain-containing protein